MVGDALAALALVRECYPELKLHVMGESMGAAVAILTAKRASGASVADGFVLLAPAVWERATMSLFERAGLWLADLLPPITWSPRLLPVTIRVSDNAAMLRALHADPLVIKTTRSDTLSGLVDLMERPSTPRRISPSGHSFSMAHATRSCRARRSRASSQRFPKPQRPANASLSTRAAITCYCAISRARR